MVYIILFNFGGGANLVIVRSFEIKINYWKYRIVFFSNEAAWKTEFLYVNLITSFYVLFSHHKSFIFLL